MNINLTLFGQLIAFAIFAAMCMRWIWPPLQAVFEERKQRIAKGLEDARSAALDREKAALEATEQLAIARQKAAELVESARKRAALIVEEANEKARKLADENVQRSAQEAESQLINARESLIREMGELVSSATSRLLQDALSDTERKKVLSDIVQRL
ncbi:MAG: F0F1 ATP synthase subunit B [Gammaproteobacteria bacterium]